MDTEKRKYQRFDLNLFVTLGVGQEQSIQARGVNLSRSGILCHMDEDCEIPASVYVILNFKSEGGVKRVELEGVVIRRAPSASGSGYDYGISIVEVKEEDKPAFEEFLESLG